MLEQTKVQNKAEVARPRRLNIWLIVSIVLAIALVGVIVTNAGGGKKGGEGELVVLEADEASNKLLEFINKVYGPQVGIAALKETTDENGLYKVVVTVNNPAQNAPVDQTVYVTKDAQLFIPQVINIEQVSQQFDALQQQQQQQPPPQQTPPSTGTPPTPETPEEPASQEP